MGERAGCFPACAICGQPLLPVGSAALAPDAGRDITSRRRVAYVCVNPECLEFDVATAAS